ncbi:MAG TPA: hypothetical protein VJO32_16115 [Ktedonobacteraceae bacterium]|nr:hypothetical protein [Ktedonobacteraceae bacterium]
MAPSQDSFPENANQPSVSTPVDTKETRIPKVGHTGNVEFERFISDDLQSLPVLVQALDNQWMPNALLKSTLEKRQITKRTDNKLRKAVRSEYIRSLINGQQVILNRAYLYNNAIISQDFVRKNNPQREAFRELLEDEVIIPYLYAEQTPVDLPNYEKDEKAFSAWQELCQDVRTRCVRLSWDDKENLQLARRHLAERFHRFALAAPAGDVETYLRDLNLDKSAESGLRQRLIDLGHFCLDFSSRGKSVTRNDLYKAFVTAGDNPAERKYDISKPFASEIKQLIDLSYNCNLPDALGGYLITPVDSLPRTALQEWQKATKQPGITGGELLTLLQRTAFDLVERGLNVKSMDALSLQDVQEIRKMDEWTLYIESVEKLLNNPLNFADGGADRIYERYNRLAKRITNLIAGQDRKDNILTSWSPVAELVFYIAGAVLSCIWTTSGPVIQLMGQVAGDVGAAAVPVVGRLVIRDRAEKKARQDLSTSVDFMRFSMRHAKEEWREIESQVQGLSGYQQLTGKLQTKEIVDPILSYPDYFD